MISLKRNSKLELVPATGRRSQSKSIYSPNQKEDFKISRGRFDNFLTCPRCFYMDRVIGLSEPGMPGWSLNSATDELLKKEFDEFKENVPEETVLQIVDYYAKRPQVQERLTMQIVKELQKALNTQDVACIIDAKHLCVNSRGIRDIESSTVTSEFGGKFKEENVRREFLDYIKLDTKF
jgi:hypothetical protein